LDLFQEGEVHLLCLVERRLELLVLLFEALDLQALPLTRRLGGAAVAEDTLDSALFLLVLGLGSFSWWEVGLWLWEHLAPGLPLLDLLLLGLGGALDGPWRLSQGVLCEGSEHRQVWLVLLGHRLR
jgi:hypothetical protein